MFLNANAMLHSPVHIARFMDALVRLSELTPRDVYFRAELMSSCDVARELFSPHRASCMLTVR